MLGLAAMNPIHTSTPLAVTLPLLPSIMHTKRGAVYLSNSSVESKSSTYLSSVRVRMGNTQRKKKTNVAAVNKCTSFRSNGVFLLSPAFLRAAVSTCSTIPTL